MEAEAPQLAGIVVLANGEVWVANYEYLLELPTIWKVFRSAAHIGDVATPERFRVHSVRGSMVAGVWLDELDVEHVQVHRMSCQLD